jgi:RimJ/RimL family protein N-acetyltransferase
MLTQVKDLDKVARAASDELAHRFLIEYARGTREHFHDENSLALTDDNDAPSLIVLMRGPSVFALARDNSGYKRIAEDLFHERIDCDPAWPTPGVKEDWEHMSARGLWTNASPLVMWEFMEDAGFEQDLGDHDHRHAYLWVIEGKPRFGDLVQHPCRLGEGEELWNELRLGIHYDPEGEYIKMCLQRGPSFVCEVDGKKVCWSNTHLSGTMGMIYTPPEHRRHGYAKSLAAFQVDHMLEHYGVACAHVVSTNIASQGLMMSLGSRRINEPLVWRTMYWPGEAVKAKAHHDALMAEKAAEEAVEKKDVD